MELRSESLSGNYFKTERTVNRKYTLLNIGLARRMIGRTRS